MGSIPIARSKFAEGEFDPEDSANCDEKEQLAYLKDINNAKANLILKIAQIATKRSN